MMVTSRFLIHPTLVIQKSTHLFLPTSSHNTFISSGTFLFLECLYILYRKSYYSSSIVGNSILHFFVVNKKKVNIQKWYKKV